VNSATQPAFIGGEGSGTLAGSGGVYIGGTNIPAAR